MKRNSFDENSLISLDEKSIERIHTPKKIIKYTECKCQIMRHGLEERRSISGASDNSFE